MDLCKDKDSLFYIGVTGQPRATRRYAVSKNKQRKEKRRKRKKRKKKMETEHQKSTLNDISRYLNCII